ncbi:MAG TPA: hypothetical protein VM187_09605 [Niastella sp.]|nr:hypothetical protein [Niastella sp.]
MEFNPPYTQSGGFSGLVAMYSDGANNSYEGYDHITIKDNYFVLHGYGIALHAPWRVTVNNIIVTSNRWKWSADASDKDYTNAVCRNASLSMPNYKDAVNGKKWADNRWAHGPYKDQFLLPDNRTTAMEY